jgi:uncharacterized protein (DUF2252 family)
MRESAFVFLRGTFYRWMQVWPIRCAALDDAPTVVGVGDLHLESFGTWRDDEGRLVWGVNDVDEACKVPYTLDLVRLATSALLAIREGHFAIAGPSACAAILDGYRSSLDRGGFPLIIDRESRVGGIVRSRQRDPQRYWARLASFPRATGRVPRRKLRAALPDPNAPCTFVHRIVGVGSLGRQRFVALARDGDTLVAREAKALLPSAAAWARDEKHPKIYVKDLLDDAVRVPDPSFAASGRWMIRRLAPDCARIELADLPAERDELKLLRAMGWETANLHLGSRRRKIAKHLDAQKRRWLERAAEEMAAATTDDFRAWVSR